ncbi:MAG: plasmid mobilization relaxosome protein MobC [Solobacterium sp.]|nr:plasmid mobilization relaxosome protein MobC [Solobacterium sp.]
MSGRKKKTLPPPKEQRITIRLTEYEYQVLKKECQLSQLSVSEYIRRLLLNREIPIYPVIIHDEHEILEELRKINKVGNNLNQIARHLNQGGVMTNSLALELRNIAHHMHDSLIRLDEAAEKEYQAISKKK